MLGTVFDFFELDKSFIVILHEIGATSRKGERLIFLEGNLADVALEKLEKGDYFWTQGKINLTPSGRIYRADKYTYIKTKPCDYQFKL